MSEQEQTVQEQPIFSIEKLYVKNLSLEVPHAPQIFLEQETPEVDMRISTDGQQIEEGFYECSVTVTVTAKLSDNRVVFLNEVSQAGIFRLSGIPEDDIKLLLGVACPNILFPYAREVVSTTVTRAGFPPVLLAPINFEAMYNQAQEQAVQ
ncbi:MAG: protein-export chaperone SecB [Alysiella sp.]|uniref:protein-export chaperone SecB n=1 Tax=Alysiella sp. TaxID=1872483 RepID=UPI0026DCD257|nr:protein-export chaperone SecB [Alysiella sp.]MDO4433542.1 protein-export chaperone SecB [Alysiella sp.]